MPVALCRPGVGLPGLAQLTTLKFYACLLQENLKVLLRYLVDTFWDQLAKFETLSSLHALKVKYEQVSSLLLCCINAPHFGGSANETHCLLQSLESVGTASTGTLLDQRKRLDERALDKEEEDYFNEDRSVSLR